MKWLRILGGVILVLTLTVSAANAVQLTVDTDKIDSSLAAQLLEAQKKAATQSQPAVSVAEQAKEWAGIGKEVGSAFSETAKALSVETNEFIKTPVGKWTLVFVTWYLIGHKVWSIVAGITIWIVLGTIILHSFRRLHMAQPVVIEQEDKTKEIEWQSYPWDSRDGMLGSLWAHCLSFGALSLIMILVVLL